MNTPPDILRQMQKRSDDPTLMHLTRDERNDILTHITALSARCAALEEDGKAMKQDYRDLQKRLLEHDRKLAQATATLSIRTQQLLTAEAAARPAVAATGHKEAR